MANKDDKNDKSDSVEDLEDGIGVGELVKKLVSAGIGAAFMTEEGVRSYLKRFLIYYCRVPKSLKMR